MNNKIFEGLSFELQQNVIKTTKNLLGMKLDMKTSWSKMEDWEKERFYAVLREEVKRAYKLRYYDSMTYEQMSAVLGISQQAINGRLRRAKNKMAQYLRKTGFVEV